MEAIYPTPGKNEMSLCLSSSDSLISQNLKPRAQSVSTFTNSRRGTVGFDLYMAQIEAKDAQIGWLEALVFKQKKQISCLKRRADYLRRPSPWRLEDNESCNSPLEVCGEGLEKAAQAKTRASRGGDIRSNAFLECLDLPVSDDEMEPCREVPQFMARPADICEKKGQKTREDKLNEFSNKPEEKTASVRVTQLFEKISASIFEVMGKG